MPSFSSPSPPIPTRAIDDVRPSPNAQSLLATPPPTHKTSPVPAKSTPVTREDSCPPPVAKERVGSDPPNESIDRSVFDQVLELDEDDVSYSKDVVEEYFNQADKTFEDMNAALVRKDLKELSSLGHFLKGSSAALGAYKVQSSCQDIQDIGQLQKDNTILTESDAIVKITKSIARVREEYADAKAWLDWYYATHSGEEE